MEQSKSIDTNLIDDYFNNLGREMVDKMLNLYVFHSKDYLKNIKTAGEDGSDLNWRESCHKMKGSAAAVGLIELSQQLKALEHEDVAKLNVEQTVDQLMLANNTAIKALEQYVQAK